MSRILSGHSEEKSATPSETKSSQSKPTVAKTVTEKAKPKTSEEAPKPAVSKPAEQKPQTTTPPPVQLIRKTGRPAHVLMIVLVAVAVFAVSELSARPLCASQLGSQVCNLVQGNLYAVTISFFVGTETFEFLLGRMGTVDGSSPMDAGLLVKDLVLFSFLVLLLQHARNTGLLPF